MATLDVALEDMTVNEVADWLQEKGFEADVVDSFKQEEMDGKAIAIGISTSPGPDWLKEIVKKVGIRLKVHRELRALLLTTSAHKDSEPAPPTTPVTPRSTSPSISNGSSGATVNYSSGSVSDVRKTVPKNFPIPRFRPNTLDNFQQQVLTDSDRKYVVQTLATMLMTYVQRPSLNDCCMVAKSLLQKYPFLKDDTGSNGEDGEHSWKWFIYYRCQNINRNSGKSSSIARKKLKLDKTNHFYPPINSEDEVSYKRNMELLKAEIGKAKPRSETVKMLLRQTFPNRWQQLVDGERWSTVTEYLMDFPILRKMTYASLEFALVLQRENVRDEFEQHFPKWAEAIIKYCKDTQIRSSTLQAITAEYTEDLASEDSTLMALQCLFILFAPGRTKKLTDKNIPFVLSIARRGTSTAEVIQIGNGQPYIIWFTAEEDDEVTEQLFVVVEESLMLETNSLLSALFGCIAAHYIFNVSYHPKTGDFWVFIQEKIFEIQSKNMKKLPSTSAHFAGISRLFDSVLDSASDIMLSQAYDY